MIKPHFLKNLPSSRTAVPGLLQSEELPRIATCMGSEAEFYSQTISFYEHCAELYDYLYPDHLAYSKRLFEALLPILNKHGVRRILDSSCGVGHDMSCLLGYGFDVDGIDICPSMLVEARRRLSRMSFRRCSLYEGDVRQLDSVVSPGTYDLVLFRGNTLSNIQPIDVPQVVEQLVNATRPGGLVCIDYRDGWEMFQEKRSFEFRGLGCYRSSWTGYFSFYTVDHSEHIHLPYRVKATVLRFGLVGLPRVDHLEIRSHYVLPEQVLSAAQENGCKLLPVPSIPVHGLPHLENVIAVKDITSM